MPRSGERLIAACARLALPAVQSRGLTTIVINIIKLHNGNFGFAVRGSLMHLPRNAIGRSQ